MFPQWLVLLPPIIVIATAFITKKVLLSLFLGIISSGIIIGHGSIGITIGIILQRFWDQADPTNLYTFGFLLTLGCIIALMNQTGATTAYSAIISKKIKSKKSAESTSILLSLCFMIDDFFSSITVGCIMRPLTDRFSIPRVKLAYLIDSLAAPLVILIPVSSWVAMIIAQLENAGISVISPHALIASDPFGTYLRLIPYIFYSYINLASVLFIVRLGISYGPMKIQEDIAKYKNNLYGGKVPLKNDTDSTTNNGSLFDFILPIASLLISVFASMLYAGNYYLFGGNHSFAQALSQPNIIFFALFMGGCITLIISLIWYFSTNKITLKNLPTIALETKELMLGSMIVLLLAWTFTSLLVNDLHTGDYLAHLLLGSCSPILLPMLFYVLASITSISIGSSWGTIAVLVPLGVPMITTLTGLTTPILLTQAPLALPLLGAIFAGAVTGDHISPIAGTTLMSSTSTGSYHEDHVKTQLIYALPGLIATIFAFLLAGTLTCYLSPFMVILTCLTAGIAICFILHWFNMLYFNRKTKNGL